MRGNGQLRLRVDSGSARGPSPGPEALAAKSCGDPIEENWRSALWQTEMIVVGKFFHINFRAQFLYRSYIGLLLRNGDHDSAFVPINADKQRAVWRV